MARKAFVAGAEKRISHPDDKENPTVYVIQAIPFRIRSWISDQAMEVGSNHYASGKIAALGLQAGLKNIENLLDEGGNAIPISTSHIKANGLTHECIDVKHLDQIPPGDVAWLQSELLKFTTTSEDEVKK